MAAFTDAQTDAINAQGGSVLVSAAAGSGQNYRTYQKEL